MSIKQRGFASLSEEKRRELARKGGIAAHAKGTGHEWTSAEAAAAGRKGGMASRGGKGKIKVSGANGGGTAFASAGIGGAERRPGGSVTRLA